MQVMEYSWLSGYIVMLRSALESQTTTHSQGMVMAMAWPWQDRGAWYQWQDCGAWYQ